MAKKRKPRRPKPTYLWLLLAGLVTFGLAGCAWLEPAADVALGTDDPNAPDTDADGFSDGSLVELVDDMETGDGVKIGAGAVALWALQRLAAARRKAKAAETGGAS